jgi:uncharacterized protein (TIGR03435 family)
VDRADLRLGPGLKRSDVDCTDREQIVQKNPDGTSKCGFRGGPGSRRGRQTMTVLAALLTTIVADHLTVQDRTGLPGTYEVELEWAPDVPAPADGSPVSAADPNAVSIFTAVREQLGLRLVPARQQIDVLVVDSAERPTEN